MKWREVNNGREGSPLCVSSCIPRLGIVMTDSTWMSVVWGQEWGHQRTPEELGAPGVHVGSNEDKDGDPGDSVCYNL